MYTLAARDKYSNKRHVLCTGAVQALYRRCTSTCTCAVPVPVPKLRPELNELNELNVEVSAILWLCTATPRHGSEEISSADITNDLRPSQAHTIWNQWFVTTLSHCTYCLPERDCTLVACGTVLQCALAESVQNTPFYVRSCTLHRTCANPLSTVAIGTSPDNSIPRLPGLAIGVG